MVAQGAQVGGARVDPDRDADVVNFLGGKQLTRIDFPGIQNLAAQRHDGLGLAVAGLLRRAARGIALDEEQLGQFGLLQGAVGELARQRRPRHDFLACLVAGLLVLVEPERETVLDDARDEAGHLA